MTAFQESRPDFQVVQPREDTLEFQDQPAFDRLPTIDRAKIIEKVEYPESGGIFVYFKGYTLPLRGITTPEALASVDIVKKVLLMWVKVMGSKPLRYFVPFVLILPSFIFKKIAQNWIKEFTALGHPLLKFYYRKPERNSEPVREIYRVGMKFAGEEFIYQELVRMICLILETDFQYRFRLQDILSELNKENLNKNPAKELTRLTEILMKRDHARGWREVGFFFKILLVLRPEVKRLVRQFSQEINLEKVKLSKEDLYFFVVNPMYDVGGRLWVERTKIFNQLHGSKLDWESEKEGIKNAHPEIKLE